VGRPPLFIDHYSGLGETSLGIGRWTISRSIGAEPVRVVLGCS
jgi:hypothetical protein